MRVRARVRVSPWLVALLCLSWAALAQDKSPEEWFDDGLGYVGQQKFADAEAALTAAVKADPRYKEAWQALAEVLELQGKTARAELCRQQAEAAPATRDGNPPPLTPAQRIALIDRGGGTPPAPGQPAQPAPPAQPAAPAQPAPPQPAATVPLKPLPALTTKGGDGKTKPMVTLSQHGKAVYCDIACTPDGTLHAIFTDRPETSDHPYLYYRMSQDAGKTWSAPVNLSDDESGRQTSYCNLAVDGAGRLYAFWKYIGVNEILDGPGGYKDGVLTMRCWQGGQWSPQVTLNLPNEPISSWYTTVDAAGRVHLVYSQTPADSMEAMRFTSYDYCNRVAERVLDGANIGPVSLLIEPPPLPTKAQLDAAQQAGRPIPLSDQSPKKNGLSSLRGMLGTDGRPVFVAEHPGGVDQYGYINTGRRIVLWDGAALRPLYEYEKYATYLTYENPPTLLIDPTGQRHLIRSPEKSELPCIRDYPLMGITPTEPLTLLACQKGSGKITSFQARNLPGNRMVVMAAMTEQGGDAPLDHELYVMFSDGGGQWTKPFCATDNVSRLKETTGGGAGGMRTNSRTTYGPQYAAMTIDNAGRPCILLVSKEITAMGGTTPGLMAGGVYRSTTVSFIRL